MPCRYYDCGWCYYPEPEVVTAVHGMCNAMESCPKSVSWDSLIAEPPKLLKFQDDGDDSEDHW